MKYLYNITLEDYKEVIDLALANGKKPGENMEEEFAEVMRKKGRKPVGATELNKEELLREYSSHGKNILDMKIDDKGETTFREIKGKENE